MKHLHSYQRWYKFGGLLFLLAVGIGASVWSEPATLFSRDALRALADEHFVLTVASFILLTVVATMLFVPFTPISIIAGYVFGPLIGVPVALTAIVVAAVVPFTLARTLGAAFVDRQLAKRAPRLGRYKMYIERQGFYSVLLLRVVPVLPKTVVDMLFGLTRISPLVFVLATILGALPGIVLLVQLGDTLLRFTDPRFYAYLTAYVLYVGLVILLERRHQQRVQQGHGQDGGW